MKVLDRLGGVALTVASVGGLDALAFFSVRDELVKWGSDFTAAVQDRVTGLSRFDRTQRLVAAHAVIVITSFYEALGNALDAEDRQVSLQDLRLTRVEKIEVVTDAHCGRRYWRLVEVLLDAPIPIPEPQSPYEETLCRLRDYYGTLSGRVTEFVKGLAVWNQLTRSDRERLGGRFGGVVSYAVRRYEDNYRRLAAQVPEFAVWANLTDHRATRAAVERSGGELRDRLAALSTGLEGIPEILACVSGQAAADKVFTDLACRYRAAIEASVLSGADTPDGVSLPSLEVAYVNPRCRVAVIGKDARPADDRWWDDAGVAVDVQMALTGLLTTPLAVDAPLVILGQPGAGKSVLTKMLCARLLDSGFLPVRVELRSVPADAPVQAQVEYAIQDMTGREIPWPDLTESANGALPVVLVDGFDELLQATGVNRSDYLEHVAEFQRREYELGRPVAAIVTSRTVVADRARFPQGSVALKLEPFDEAQVATWLDIWNKVNAVEFAARGVGPLPVKIALTHRELASQPLLLLMLALYDARANTLQNASGELSRTELYEQLLTDFMKREIRKHRPSLDIAGETREVDAELRRLSVVALAMFNRHSQIVTEAELNKDLPVMLPVPAPIARAGLHKPLTAAQVAIGRFFFIHESQALRDSEMEHGFEFLHATFGEFLVARITVATLRELAEERAFNARRAIGPRMDDSFLWATLSFAGLTGRAAVVEFADGLLRRLPGDVRAAINEVATDLLREALYPQPSRSFIGYEPQFMKAARRYAAYSCNLAVLAVLSADGPVPMDGWDPGLWWSQLTFYEWDGLCDTVRVHQHFDQGATAPKLWAQREDGAPIRPGATLLQNYQRPAGVPSRTYNYLGDFEVPADSEAGRRLRSAAFFPNALGAPGGLAVVLMPYYRHIADGSNNFIEGNAQQRRILTPASALLELRLAAPQEHDARVRTELYKFCINVTDRTKKTHGWLPTIFRQLREDARELDANITAELLRFASDHNAVDLTGFLDVLTVLGDKSTEQLYEILPFLAAYLEKTPQENFSADQILEANALFARYGFDDPFTYGQIT